MRVTRNYYLNTITGKYVIYKILNGKKVDFGSYDDECMVKLIIDKLDFLGWNKPNLFDIQIDLFGEVVSKRMYNNYYHKNLKRN